MKSTSFAVVIYVASLAGPAAAQTSPSDDFVAAVRDRDGDKAQQVLDSNPNVVINGRDSSGETALTLAVTRRDTTWTGFLLQKGADPNVAGKAGDTPLILATRIGFDQAIVWLLSVGAKVDATNKMGETALITAVVQRQLQAVRRLLAAGADPDKADAAAGYSAREYAQRDTRSRDILRLIEAKKTAQSK